MTAPSVVSGVDRAQTVMEREIAKPPRMRNSVQAYNDIARALALPHSGFRVSRSESTNSTAGQQTDN